MSERLLRIRLVFVDGGEYHREEVLLPATRLDGYDRLIDCLREEPDVLRSVYIDLDRLCTAYVIGPQDGVGAVGGGEAELPAHQGGGSLLPFSSR